MGARTSGREAALQMLFALEASGDDVEVVISRYWRSFEGHPESRAYAEELVRGVSASLVDIDTRVRAASHNWRLERMTRVDRNVLRIGAWELSMKRETPRPVVLDEAVELAKSFGTLDSGAFVNGVLDRVADELARR